MPPVPAPPDPEWPPSNRPDALDLQSGPSYVCAKAAHARAVAVTGLEFSRETLTNAPVAVTADLLTAVPRNVRNPHNPGWPHSCGTSANIPLASMMIVDRGIR